MKITLCYIVLVHLDPVVIPCEENAFALAAVFRFNDEGFSFFVVKLFLKVFYVGRKHPSFWKKLKFSGEILLHLK